MNEENQVPVSIFSHCPDLRHIIQVFFLCVLCPFTKDRLQKRTAVTWLKGIASF